MTPDLLLALAHHAAAFALVAVVAMQWVLAGLPPGPALIRRLGRLDLAYGVLAGAVLIIGALRVVAGDKGWAFYRANPAFHAKLALFLLVGLISILPTLRFIQWRRHLTADENWTVPDGQWRLVRRSLAAEFHLLLIIPLFAAAAARGLGMG